MPPATWIAPKQFVLLPHNIPRNANYLLLLWKSPEVQSKLVPAKHNSSQKVLAQNSLPTSTNRATTTTATSKASIPPPRKLSNSPAKKPTFGVAGAVFGAPQFKQKRTQLGKRRRQRKLFAKFSTSSSRATFHKFAFIYSASSKNICIKATERIKRNWGKLGQFDGWVGGRGGTESGEEVCFPGENPTIAGDDDDDDG